MSKRANLSDKKSSTSTELPTLEDNNIYLLMDDFTDESIRPVIEFILRKNFLPQAQRPEHLTLVINSPGGSLTAAFALIDIMKGSAIPVHTLGIGQISSCGLLTFIAGVKGHRVLTTSTSILSHQWSWGSAGKSHELFAAVREFELTDKRMMDLYKKCTGLNESQIRELLLPAKDVWLSAEEAVEMGIADEIRKTY
jgi:ATP-dependent Clp protease, protease subunit